jgi:hypothetical protein
MYLFQDAGVTINDALASPLQLTKRFTWLWVGKYGPAGEDSLQWLLQVSGISFKPIDRWLLVLAHPLLIPTRVIQNFRSAMAILRTHPIQDREGCYVGFKREIVICTPGAHYLHRRPHLDKFMSIAGDLAVSHWHQPCYTRGSTAAQSRVSTEACIKSNVLSRGTLASCHSEFSDRKVWMLALGREPE